jgi:hypothetical protein
MIERNIVVALLTLSLTAAAQDTKVVVTATGHVEIAKSADGKTNEVHVSFAGGAGKRQSYTTTAPFSVITDGGVQSVKKSARAVSIAVISHDDFAKKFPSLTPGKDTKTADVFGSNCDYRRNSTGGGYCFRPNCQDNLKMACRLHQDANNGYCSCDPK